MAAFADGYMRFLDLQTLKNLGRVRITQECVSSIAFSESGGSFLFGDRGGSLNFVAIESWDPLTIKHQEIGVLECGIDSIAFQAGEPGGSSTFLATLASGKVNTWRSQGCGVAGLVAAEEQDEEDVQYMMVDSFDIFENPHQMEMSEDERMKIQILYASKVSN